jgi:carbamoyltransferase
MTILGIGGLLNEAACAILKNGEITAAVEQKKVARNHRPGEMPDEAIAACLQLAAARVEDVDCVAVVRPFAFGPEALLHLDLRERFPNAKVAVVEHHVAHAASVYFASPFEEATVLTLDRKGDFRCASRWQACRSQLQSDREAYFPDSLGDLYGRVTELLGFEPNAEEHKVQWLSTDGDARFVPLFEDIISSHGSDWPRPDRSYFDGDRQSRGRFSPRFYERLGLPDGSEVPENLRSHIAAGLQQAVEKTVLAMAGEGRNLCLAGGLNYNALLIAALERSGRWQNVFVQPASGNVGTCIGAVLYAWHSVYQQAERVPFRTLFLGPSYTAEEIKKVVENCKLRFRYLLTGDELIERAVAELNDHKIVAWMQGRMEFGPRALGNRSILASPLDPYSSVNLNTYIKHRESFRKFAASVPEELVSEYFEVGPNARFLATVGRVRPAHRKTFQSAILGDDVVRVHTVAEEDNPLYHRLLLAAGNATGLPVLYNTSFNLFGDPLVCTPRDAVRSFYSSGIDVMFVGNFLLEK